MSILGWWETFWLGLALGLGIRFAGVVIGLTRRAWLSVEELAICYWLARWPNERE